MGTIWFDCRKIPYLDREIDVEYCRRANRFMKWIANRYYEHLNRGQKAESAEGHQINESDGAPTPRMFSPPLGLGFKDFQESPFKRRKVGEENPLLLSKLGSNFFERVDNILSDNNVVEEKVFVGSLFCSATLLSSFWI